MNVKDAKKAIQNATTKEEVNAVLAKTEAREVQEFAAEKLEALEADQDDDKAAPEKKEMNAKEAVKAIKSAASDEEIEAVLEINNSPSVVKAADKRSEELKSGKLSKKIVECMDFNKVDELWEASDGELFLKEGLAKSHEFSLARKNKGKIQTPKKHTR